MAENINIPPSTLTTSLNKRGERGMTRSAPRSLQQWRRVMFPYYPPYPYPQQNTMSPPLTASEFERGIKIAMKLKSKEENKIKKKEEAEKKKKEEDKKRMEAARMRSLTGIEWFIIGLLMYPVVGPAYKLLTHNLEVFSSGVH